VELPPSVQTIEAAAFSIDIIRKSVYDKPERSFKMEITKAIILENMNNPKLLEDLYQSNKKMFSEIIKAMHEEDPSVIMEYWYARLFYKPLKKKTHTVKYIFTAALVILSWIPIRLMFSDSFEESNYMIKAIPIIFSVALSLFFLFGSMKTTTIFLSLFPHIVIYLYFILLPNKETSQSLDNAVYFMFGLLWFFVLFAQSNCNIKKLDFLGFIEKTGETIVWSIIFVTGGAVVVTLSVALFDSININAGHFYYTNIVTLGLVASPFVSLLVIENNDKSKLSVITANIFLPLILFSLIVFGIISAFTETKPYEDRNIFIIYNIMMVIVICVLIFTSINGINNKIINICSYILPIVTVILDAVTISAAVYRLNKYGITPNKITVLGANIIMLGHLIYMIYLKAKQKIERNIAYLPIYFFWAICVVFILPFIFKMA
jgi:hypothetical protein